MDASNNTVGYISGISIPATSGYMQIQSHTLFTDWKCASCGAAVKANQSHGIDDGCLCPYPEGGIGQFRYAPANSVTYFPTIENTQDSALGRENRKLKAENAALRSMFVRIRGMLESVGLTI